MTLLTASPVGLAVVTSPLVAQQSNSAAAEHKITIHTTTNTTHVQGTVPVTHHKRHHRVVRRHRVLRHHPVRHHRHVVKKTTVTTTTTHS
jgi:hypothetical protein